MKDVDPKDYVWVVTEEIEGNETLVGLSQDSGQSFIPVTQTKEDGQALLAQLPTGQGGTREVAATHKSRLLSEAKQNGFEVILVSAKGELLERLDG